MIILAAITAVIGPIAAVLIFIAIVGTQHDLERPELFD